MGVASQAWGRGHKKTLRRPERSSGGSLTGRSQRAVVFAWGHWWEEGVPSWESLAVSAAPPLLPSLPLPPHPLQKDLLYLALCPLWMEVYHCIGTELQ